MRRLKKLRFDVHHILDVYTKEVRSLLELAVPAWHSGLTKLQSYQIERVQKTAFKIIIGEDNVSYDLACDLLEMEPLEQRRIRLCLNFAKKDLKSPKTMFTKQNHPVNTRAKRTKVKEIMCRTTRYRKSPLPYLSNLLNES